MKSNWRSSAIIVAIIFLLTLLAYGGATSYSFMYDDPLELVRGEGRSILSLLTSSEGYASFRPLPFILWQAMRGAVGWYDTFWFHLMPVLAHALNGCLVYLLASRLIGRRSASLAAVLFVLYPFSYQAVPWVSALFHPLATLFILSAILCYDRWRRRPAWPWMALSLVSAGLALLSHELGVVVGPLVLAWEGWLWWQLRPQRPSLWPLAHLGLGVAFVVAWMAVPKQKSADLVPLDALGLWQNMVYFLQGFTYPLTGALGWLGEALSLEPETLLLPAIALTLIFLLAAYLRGKSMPVLLLALWWLAVAVLPVWVVRGFSYVIDGPRLLYLSSVGTAIAWAGLCSLRFGNRLVERLWRGLALLSVVLIAWQGGDFIAKRGVLYEQGSQIVRQLVDTAAATGGQGRLLYVNFPSWLATRSTEYALGHTGVTMVPDYIGLERVVYVHKGVRPQVEALHYDDILRPWQYHLGPYGNGATLETLDTALRRADTVYVTDILSDSLKLRQVGWLRPGVVAPSSGLASWDNAFLLQTAQAQVVAQGIAVELAWACRQPRQADLTVFLHLYDSSGKLVAQTDGYPVGSLSPLRLWQAGDSVQDLRFLPVPGDLAKGEYTLAVGIYDRATGKRVVALDGQGVRYADDAVTVARLSWP